MGGAEQTAEEEEEEKEEEKEEEEMVRVSLFVLLVATAATAATAARFTFLLFDMCAERERGSALATSLGPPGAVSPCVVVLSHRCVTLLGDGKMGENGFRFGHCVLGRQLAS